MRGLIDRYKSYKSRMLLSKTYSKKYAFVGIGGHSMNNLYPVIRYLDIPLKYIVCRDRVKASLIEKKYPGITALTDISVMLDDPEIAGVFVSTGPASHFELSSRVIASGKSLFVEKPPCRTLAELEKIAAMTREAGSPAVVAGLQKRYSPCAEILGKKLGKNKAVSYTFSYKTGLYPEGDEMAELFIHPIDLAIYLFGKAELKYARKIISKRGGVTYFVVLEHSGGACGSLELSTDYSWKEASEILVVNTGAGIYSCENLESLVFCPKQGSVMGLPVEKVMPKAAARTVLYGRNGFVPLAANNQMVSQGFYSEIDTFAEIVEGRLDSSFNKSSFEQIASTYRLIADIKSTTV